jgi:hypothetical protein
MRPTVLQLKQQLEVLESILTSQADKSDLLERLVNSLNAELHPTPTGKVPEWILKRELERIEQRKAQVALSPLK